MRFTKKLKHLRKGMIKVSTKHSSLTCMHACKGAPLSKIDGLPIAIKDNILVKGMDCTAASIILKGKRGIH